MKRNDSAVDWVLVVLVGRSRKMPSDLHKRVSGFIGRQWLPPASAEHLADFLRTAGARLTLRSRFDPGGAMRKRARRSSPRQPPSFKRTTRRGATAQRERPKDRRTTSEINETAGQSHTWPLAVVGRFRPFLDLVLPQCCPRAGIGTAPATLDPPKPARASRPGSRQSSATWIASASG